MSLKAVYTDTDDLDPAPGVRKLQEMGFEVITLETHDPEVIARNAADADALLVGYAPISAQTLKRMEKLQIVSLLATGYDNIDVAAATARGICVANIGSTSTEEVATHALALMLSLLRGIGTYKEVAGRREWFKTPYPHVPPRLSELKLGLIGFGNIGRRLATLANPLFREIIFYDPQIPAGVTLNGALFLSLQEVLAESDVLSLHLPLTDQTHHLIDSAAFFKMKKGVYLINVSRGGLINPTALEAALDSKIVLAAGLDVLETEPPTELDRIWLHPKVLITPHVAFLSQYSIGAYIDVQSENVVQWFSGKEVKYTINGIGIKK